MTTHILANDAVSAIISEHGAELKSLRHVPSGEEYIWQGDAAIWKDSAPILFPVVGRLKGGAYSHQNKSYQLPIHGFASTALFSVLNKDDTSLTLLLKSNDDTLRCFPFSFELLVTFSLQQASLAVDYQIRNIGKEQLFFTIGSHPGFSLPVNDGPVGDFFIEFEQPEILELFQLEGDLLSVDAKPYLNNERIIALSESLFDRDALIFKNVQSRKISLCHSQLGKRLTLHMGAAPHLGIWAKPAAPYVCLEPWHGHDDSIESAVELSEKAGILSLDPDTEFNTGYVVEIFTPYDE